MKRIALIFASIFCLSSAALADIASPSFSPLIGVLNPAVHGYSESGMAVYAGSTSTKTTTTSTSASDYGVLLNGDTFFGGAKGSSNSGVSASSYFLGLSLSELKLAVSADGNNTATAGLSWNFSKPWYLGFKTDGNNNDIGIAYVSDNWRFEYGNGITFEYLAGDWLFGYDGNFNGPATASSVYLGWQQPKGGLSVLFENLTSSSLTSGFDSGSRMSVGIRF